MVSGRTPPAALNKLLIIMIIYLFISNVLHKQTDGQLQLQHKKRAKITDGTK